MFRTIALAAVAALIAGSASAETVRISTAGKTPAQLKAEVAAAAAQLCRQETAGTLVEINPQRVCVEHTVRAALAHGPALATAVAER